MWGTVKIELRKGVRLLAPSLFPLPSITGRVMNVVWDEYKTKNSPSLCTMYVYENGQCILSFDVTFTIGASTKEPIRSLFVIDNPDVTDTITI